MRWIDGPGRPAHSASGAELPICRDWDSAPGAYFAACRRAATTGADVRTNHGVRTRCQNPGVTNDLFSAGRAFLDREGRLIERRLAAVLFDDADPSGAVAAVLAYRNADAGFGHGLEPDKRCPDSLPIDVERAFDVLLAARESARYAKTYGDLGASEIVSQACDWLASVAQSDGAVPLAFPVIEHYPRAAHWSDWTYAPGLNPTAGLAGRLHRMGVTHPWLTRATEWTWRQLESGFDQDAHALAEVLEFLAHVPGRARAELVSAQVGDWLTNLRWFRADPADPTYGLSPLHFAPSPASRWVDLFDEATIGGHLERLADDQQADGGWPVTWTPPGTASAVEWRGIETLRALRTLAAYGRL